MPTQAEYDKKYAAELAAAVHPQGKLIPSGMKALHQKVNGICAFVIFAFWLDALVAVLLILHVW